MARAVLALGAGDLEAARVELDAMERPRASRPSRSSSAPTAGCAPSWSAAAGKIDPARAAVDDALDQIEYCSDDVARIAGVAAIGRARRGRRRHAGARPARRRRRAGRAASAPRSSSTRLRLTGEAGGPVERAELPAARPSTAAPSATDDPALWAAARRGVGGARAPLPARLRALAPGRGARARRRPQRGGRVDLRGRARRARAGQRLARRPSSSRWLRGRGCGCSARPSRPARPRRARRSTSRSG